VLETVAAAWPIHPYSPEEFQILSRMGNRLTC